ncbi:MaoC family dehydratase [Eisenibacter elegans]|jgi:acyl dehydratase|uniref:MaoC family dehydratase n=1 Tax=Eisenibacter elegans TaxID=997 RepID=UPI0004157C90|nr:MaoC family dehydratase [Eisenibacter elegans]
MKIINGIAELKALEGSEIGTSDWHTISQDQINAFADATGDHQWIHIDIEKAKTFSPFGTTIAHGFLTMSLAPMFMDQIFKVEGVKMGINYGLNKLRFTSPVPAGGQLRVKAVLAKLSPFEGGQQAEMHLTYELKGQDKPACIAEFLMRFYV